MKIRSLFVVAALVLSAGFEERQLVRCQPSTNRFIYGGFFQQNSKTPIDRTLALPEPYYVLENDTLIPTAVVRNYKPVEDTTQVFCSITDFSLSSTPVYQESVMVVLGPSADVTVKLPPFVVPPGPLATPMAVDGGPATPIIADWRKGDGERLQPKPIRKGKCGFELLTVEDLGNGSYKVSKKIINKKAGPCPWSIKFYWDKFAPNSGPKNFIDSLNGSTPAGQPPEEVSTTWTPPGPGRYCVFAVTVIQGQGVIEYNNTLKVKNPPPPPPIPPPPPPPPPPPGWPPLPPGNWWHLPVPILPQGAGCVDSIPIEMVALQLAGLPWPFVPPADTVYQRCTDTNYAYLSVHVPASAGASDSSVFTVIAKMLTSGGLELGSVTFTVNPTTAPLADTLGGIKFSDWNANGTRDSLEPVIVGWKLYLTGTNADSTTTDTSGRYRFIVGTPGYYCIKETVQLGWTQTYPDSHYCLTLSGGANIDTLNFGNHNPSVGIGDDNRLPKKFSLYQNYPNPFNPKTDIRYQIAYISRVSLKVFDLLGRTVVTLVDEVQQPGQYTATWDAGGFASGVYFYRLEAREFMDQKVMILLK